MLISVCSFPDCCPRKKISQHTAVNENPADFPPQYRSVALQMIKSCKKKKSFFASTIMHICGGSCQGYLFLVFALKLHRHKFPAQIVGVCTVTFPLDSPMVFLQPTLVKRSSKSPRLSLEEDP